MIKFMVCLVLFLLSSTASAQVQLGIEEGSVDLLKDEALSKPFTLFDQILYSLNEKADNYAKQLRPEKNDFRLSTKNNHITTTVHYSTKVSRVGVQFMLFVSGMDDPWREVCKRHVHSMATTMGISGLGLVKGASIKEGFLRTYFMQHLGPKANFDSVLVPSLQLFLDAMLITVQFNVERGEEIAHLRRCDLDVKSNRLTYFEHNY